MSDRHRMPAWPRRLVRALRGAPWLVALAAVGIALAALLVVLGALDRDQAQQAAATAQDTQTALDDTAAQATSLAEQIRGECEAARLTGPICEQAADVAEDPVPGRNGTAGLDGRNGIDGLDGIDGADGADGRDGIDGLSPPCLSTPSVCQGADGRDGIDGQDGADGADGQDGIDGQDGRDGAPGPPPAGFTFVDDLGRTQTCTRDPGSPDEAATYTCTAQDGGTSMPSGLRLTAWG